MSLFSTLLGPVVVLWIGALVFYITDRFLDPQDRGAAEVIVLAMALGFVLAMSPQIGVPMRLGRMPESAATPFLVVEKASWMLALVFLCAMLAASLLSLGHSTQGRSGRLAVGGAALLFLFAGDGATLALSWVLVDLGLVYVLGRDGQKIEALGWTSLASLSGAALLGMFSAFWPQAGKDAGMPPYAAGMFMLVAVLRLLPFPLPMWQSAVDGDRDRKTHPAVRLMTFVTPALLTVLLWVRLAQGGVFATDGRWLTILLFLAAAALLVSALKSWGITDPDELIFHAYLYGFGIILGAAGYALPAVEQLTIGIGVVLSLSTLSISWIQCRHLDMSHPASYWRAAPAGLALASLMGLPFTIGFPARVALYRAVFDAQKWLWLLVVMAAEALMFGAVLRLIFEVEGMPEDGVQVPDRQVSENIGGELHHQENRDATTGKGRLWLGWMAQRLTKYKRLMLLLDTVLEWIKSKVRLVFQAGWVHEIGYGAGAALALGMLILGIAPGLLSVGKALPGLWHWFGVPRLPVWAALLLTIVGGIVLYRRQDAVLGLVQDWWPLLGRLLTFDWLYRMIEKIFRQVQALIWGATLVVEGAGYMAWVVLICLVILLFVISR